tara:strand:- start:9 stop:989 length:981 start_codon:yes stop_codon:yes gene_type:complete
MAGDPRWSALVHHLPAPKQESWKRLMPIAAFLAEATDAQYSAGEIGEAIYGERDQATAKSIGHLLAKLPGSKRPSPTVKTKNGCRLKGRFYKTKALQERLRSYGVIDIQGNGALCINSLITGDISKDVNQRCLTSIETNVALPFYPSSFIPPYPPSDLRLLEQRWAELHQCSFHTSLIIVRQILNDSIFDDDFYPDALPCLRFSKTKQGNATYATITQQYLDAALPEHGFTIPRNKAEPRLVPTLTAHRLVQHVVQPDALRRWEDDPSTHVHHVCRSRDCVLPSHHVLMLQPLHQHLHKSEGDFTHGSISNEGSLLNNPLNRKDIS